MGTSKLPFAELPTSALPFYQSHALSWLSSVACWRVVGAGRVVGLRLYDAVAAFSMVQSRAPRAAHVIITAYVGT